MAINITMPALSPTMEEGTLAKWLVKEGDSVGPGDIIAEIETDKATMEVEAVDEGTIAKILVEGGTEGVKVNAVIAVLAEEGEAPEGIDMDAVDAKVEEPKAEAEIAKAREEKVQAGYGSQNEAPPTAPTKSNGSVPLKGDADAGPVPRKDGERVFSSPLARRVAKQNGVELTALTGSGPRGRIVLADVEAAIEGGTAKAGESVPSPEGSASVSASTPPAMAAGPSDDAVRKSYADGSFEEKQHNGMRRTIASRLTESAQTVPSYTVNMACRLDALLKLRGEINAGAPEKDGKPTFKISVNDFIIKALALALQDVPMANASWTSTARLMHTASDVGVAVAVEDGLFTPIVRSAETKTLRAISAEVKDMAKRARDGKLKPQEYSGGSTSVSNLGMFGVTDFTSIINPPQASIVSIGAGVKQPVVDANGALAVGTVMNATFAFDHRVIDGALGAELAVAFRGYIENPMTMLV
ncbi:MAG: pyruvate dehydrogenase complex dihydrolipoamide acetyltransferase [Pseudomonadota bacterium]